MTKKAKSLWLATGIWAVTVGSIGLGTAFLQTAQDRPGTRILVPKGFRGYLVLKWGVVGAPPRRLVHGKYEFRFPSSGQLATSEKIENRSSSLPVGYFYDGRSTMPLKYNGVNDDRDMTDVCSPSELCLRSDGFYGNSYEVYFVGTGTEENTTNARPQL